MARFQLASVAFLVVLTSAAWPKPAGKDGEPGPFGTRIGAARAKALDDGGGNAVSEAAVAAGLQWLARQQDPGGRWQLDNPRFKDKGQANDTAGTAFGLLPFLGAGKAHKLLDDQKADDNPYTKTVEKGLAFLKSKQDKKGDFGGGMYAHALATIAVCEAYGMTKDPALRPTAQKAINFIVQAQHASNGGWRYAPNQEGDTSVTAWMVQAIKAADIAGLDVPAVTRQRAITYLNNSMSETDSGYGYVGKNSSPSMSAAGLLCRQNLQSWGPQKIEVITCVKNHISSRMPNKDNLKQIGGCYTYYYAAQVMHNYGGDMGKAWNKGLREGLIATQASDATKEDYGSWSAAGDPHGQAGGRLMTTSLNLLCLEVYYRYPPMGRAKE